MTVAIEPRCGDRTPGGCRAPSTLGLLIAILSLACQLATGGVVLPFGTASVAATTGGPDVICRHADPAHHAPQPRAPAHDLALVLLLEAASGPAGLVLPAIPGLPQPLLIGSAIRIAPPIRAPPVHMSARRHRSRAPPSTGLSNS